MRNFILNRRLFLGIGTINHDMLIWHYHLIFRMDKPVLEQILLTSYNVYYININHGDYSHFR